MQTFGRSSLPVALLASAILFSGCGAIFKQVSKLAGGEPTKLPREMISPDEDYEMLKESSCIVQIDSDSSTMLLGKEPAGRDEIGGKMRACLEGKTPEKRIVYIKSAVDVSYGTIAWLLDQVRKADADQAGFVAFRKGDDKNVRPTRFWVKLPDEGVGSLTGPIRPRPISIDSHGRPALSPEDPSEPRRTERNIKPNPLTLVVALDPMMRTTINNESYGNLNDAERLTNKLMEIFKERENNGAFREGTNEVEKTVWIKAPRGVRYGDVIKLIDAVKTAGSYPIAVQLDDLVD